jgi:hypothetical protein
MEQNLPHIRRKPERNYAQPCLSVCLSVRNAGLCMGQRFEPIPLCITSPLIHNGFGYNIDVKNLGHYSTLYNLRMGPLSLSVTLH